MRRRRGHGLRHDGLTDDTTGDFVFILYGPFRLGLRLGRRFPERPHDDLLLEVVGHLFQSGRGFFHVALNGNVHVHTNKKGQPQPPLPMPTEDYFSTNAFSAASTTFSAVFPATFSSFS